MDGMYTTPVKCCYIGGDSLTSDRLRRAGQWGVKGMLSLLETQIIEFTLHMHYSLKREKVFKYFQPTGFLLAIEVAHTHMNVKTHIPVRCWQVLEEARRSICHLQHVLGKSSGNTERC